MNQIEEAIQKNNYLLALKLYQEAAEKEDRVFTDKLVNEGLIELTESPAYNMLKEALKSRPYDLKLSLLFALEMYYRDNYYAVKEILDETLKYFPHYIPAILLKGHCEYVDNGM